MFQFNVPTLLVLWCPKKSTFVATVHSFALHKLVYFKHVFDQIC